MVRVKPFAAVRPPKDIVTEVAAPPYDVLNSQEAKDMGLTPSAQDFGLECALDVRVRLSLEDDFRKRLADAAKLEEK